MKSASLLFLAIALAGDADVDIKTMQGRWRGYVVEGKGENPDRGPVHLEIVVKGDTITAKKLEGKGDSPMGEGTFKLSVAAGQRTIDATRITNPAKGRTYPGIYSISADTFLWCTANPGMDRPKELLTKRGQFLMVLKRQL